MMKTCTTFHVNEKPNLRMMKTRKTMILNVVRIKQYIFIVSSSNGSKNFAKKQLCFIDRVCICVLIMQ